MALPVHEGVLQRGASRWSASERAAGPAAELVRARGGSSGDEIPRPLLAVARRLVGGARQWAGDSAADAGRGRRLPESPGGCRRGRGRLWRRCLGSRRRAAAGRGTEPERFCVRAVGDSMDGGSAPIRDGDWLVMRWARAASLESLQGRVALIELRSGETVAHQVKRIVREGARWLLTSDNPSTPPVEATAQSVPVAVSPARHSPGGPRAVRGRAPPRRAARVGLRAIPASRRWKNGRSPLRSA